MPSNALYGAAAGLVVAVCLLALCGVAAVGIGLLDRFALSRWSVRGRTAGVGPRWQLISGAVIGACLCRVSWTLARYYSSQDMFVDTPTWSLCWIMLMHVAAGCGLRLRSHAALPLGIGFGLMWGGVVGFVANLVYVLT